MIKNKAGSGGGHPELQKSPTGIQGLDEITNGGLPAGRTTLICGSAGAGKTNLAAEFIVNGATLYGEPGVFLMFEESCDELRQNMHSFGYDLAKLESDGLIYLDHVHVERSEILDTGEYDLEGLFIRLDHAVRKVGAKRLAIDTLEALFSAIPSEAILRAELRRLFRWLKDRGLTAVITGERGESTLTRYGLEEYVADCVILLDHRVSRQASTRRLRIVKYRGSSHGTNEYPFLIGPKGLSVMPITSMRLDHEASTEFVSTGIPKLDELLGGKGFFKGSSVLVSGSPGTGKSTLAATYAAAACARGQRALLFCYEESASQLSRNMSSIGLDLGPAIDKGLLKIHSVRPTLLGLEQHLVSMHDTIIGFKPDVVVVDPITNLTMDAHDEDIKPTLMRLVDFLKRLEITALYTSLTSGRPEDTEDSQVGVSSLMDTWLLLRNVEQNGERNRTLFVIKSRGMAHSNQVREFVMTDTGIDLVDVYLGSDRVLTGTARVAQEERERALEVLRREEHKRRLRELANRQSAIRARITALEAEADAEAAEMDFLLSAESAAQRSEAETNSQISNMRSPYFDILRKKNGSKTKRNIAGEE